MVGRSWDVFQPLLFGLIGAEITIAALSPNTVGKNLVPRLGGINILSALRKDYTCCHCWPFLSSGLGLACIFIGLVIRLIVTFLLVHFGGFNLKEKLFIAVAWLPKATVQVSASSLRKTINNKQTNIRTSFNSFSKTLTHQLRWLIKIRRRPAGSFGWDCTFHLIFHWFTLFSGCYWFQSSGHGEGGRGRDYDKIWSGCANVSRVSHPDHSSYWSPRYWPCRTTPLGAASQRWGDWWSSRDLAFWKLWKFRTF